MSAENFGQWMLHNGAELETGQLGLKKAFDAGQAFMKERALLELVGLGVNFAKKAEQDPAKAPGWSVASSALGIAGQHLEKNLDVS